MSQLHCAWDIDVSACCPPGDNTQLELVEKVIAKASTMMTRFSGFQIGLCDALLRPLVNCSSCRTWCCGGADGIRLMGPDGMWVHEVSEVTMGNTIVDPTTWEWDREEQVLWRVPPERWPKKDERWIKCGEPDAFCVNVQVGSEPDAWAIDVANELACELMKNCTGQKCRLPKNATSVSAQGISITLSEQELMTLIPEVQGWKEAVNPHDARLPARMFSPDLGHHYRGGSRYGYR